MLNKLKIFVCGFISAIIILNMPAVIASVEEYTLQRANFNIVIDGEEYKDDKLPILIKDGNTYIPLKKFCDISGMNIHWNSQLNQIEINRIGTEIGKINNEININNGIIDINLEELIGKKISVNDKELIFTKDKETSALFLDVDGTKYIQEAYVFQAIASHNKVYQFKRDEPISKEFQFRNDLYLHEILNNQIVKQNIPTVIYQGIEFIDYKFYLTHIASLKANK
ncbi:stalk domain-containing protein [Brassicibacter mesophilus]|uniref:stalk domain-containing protein n=1 Tax=Brassicibacter mesophilus TaxID=745119 RepID=UPI003D1B9C76